MVWRCSIGVERGLKTTIGTMTTAVITVEMPICRKSLPVRAIMTAALATLHSQTDRPPDKGETPGEGQGSRSGKGCGS